MLQHSCPSTPAVLRCKKPFNSQLRLNNATRLLLALLVYCDCTTAEFHLAKPSEVEACERHHSCWLVSSSAKRGLHKPAQNHIESRPIQLSVQHDWRHSIRVRTTTFVLLNSRQLQQQQLLLR
jgi:hypothetical protein